MTLLSFRDTIRKISPTWLQNGYAERVLYAVGVIADALGDGVVAADKVRFPGVVTSENLPIIGRDRRIIRGRIEPNETYVKRLRRWLDHHRYRGGPYALLEQLFAFYSPLTFPIELRYASGRRFVMSTDGTITRGRIVWSPPGDAARWARWWLIYQWPDAIPPVSKWGEGKWGDGRVWGSGLTPQTVRDIRSVPRAWNAGHSIGRITLITPLHTVTISAEG